MMLVTLSSIAKTTRVGLKAIIDVVAGQENSPRAIFQKLVTVFNISRIKDNLTGLIWLQNAGCIKTQYPSFDNDVCSTSAGDGRVTWQHAWDFIAGINSGPYPNCSGGYSDWRLPNVRELESLLDFGNFSPHLPTGHPFIYVRNTDYYTSTTVSQTASNAWLVDFGDGTMTHVAKTNCHRVWAVRDGN